MLTLGPEIRSILPLLSVTALAILLLLLEAFIKKSEPVSYWVSLLGLAGGFASCFISPEINGPLFNGMLTGGGFGNFFSALFIAAAFLSIVLSRDYLRKLQVLFGEYYLLIILSTSGMILMASASDLIMIFIGLEIMSICLYVLAGFARSSLLSNESSLKYFLLGAFATGFLLYGIALMYGATGTTNISLIVESFGRLSGSPLFWGAAGLIIIGLAFKVGAVPFHMWIPDVYQGSPTTVTGFMATGAKAAAFSAFLLVFARHLDSGDRIQYVVAILAAASMVVGNLIAVSQPSVKRMLAYSSIAHAGYMLAGVAAGNPLGRNGILFYLASYMFMNLGAFGVLSMLEESGERHLSYDDYAGLGKRHPYLAALMAMFMFSLAGVPPFAGFFAKYYVFTAAVNAHLTWLAILGVLMSVVSVYYYLKLVMVMYFQDADAVAPVVFSLPSMAAVTFAAIAIVQLGMFPSTLLSIINTIL